MDKTTTRVKKITKSEINGPINHFSEEVKRNQEMKEPSEGLVMSLLNYSKSLNVLNLEATGIILQVCN